MRGIYKITQTATGKFYIGSSRDIYARWDEHRSSLRRGKHHSKRLQNAWNKYGADAFQFELVEACEQCDGAQLLIREQYWLDSTKCYDKKIGFNIARDASAPAAGREVSAVTRARLSAARRRRGACPAETRAKISASMQGREFSTSHKNNIAVARTGQPYRGPITRSPFTAAHREKLSLARRGRKLTAEHRTKISAANSGRVLSVETRAKMSVSRKTREMSRN